MRRLRLLYPLLIAVYPILWMPSINAGFFEPSELLTVIVTVLLVSSAVYIVVAILLRKSYSGEIIAFIAALINAGFFLYLPVSESIMSAAGVTVRHWYVIPVLAIPTFVLVRWILRRRPSMESATRFLALAITLLVSVAAFRVVRNEAQATARVRDRPIVRRLAGPIPTRDDSASAPRVKRDIYLLVLDMYASSQVLRDYLHAPTRTIEDSLRALGFRMPKSVMSNYTYTELSLPSLLNFDYVNELRREEQTTRLAQHASVYLVENNRTVRFLKDAGYRFEFFPSAWWHSTRRNPHADDTFFGWDRGIGRQLRHTSLRYRVVNMTPLRWLAFLFPRGEVKHVARTFEAIAQVPRMPEPTFVFAHFMTPHRPFIADAACRELPEKDGFRFSLESPEGTRRFLAQSECADRRVIALVTTLLARSDPAPVILIVGDHGVRVLEPSGSEPGDTVTADHVRERVGAFGAYYLPGGGDLLGDSTTHVNLMRYVLNHYLSADLPPLPDSLFYSIDQKVMRFFPVTVNGGRVTQ